MARLGFTLALALIMIATPLYVAADEVPQGTVAVEKIAGYDWYHWPRAEADSCILWLGGGKVTPTYVTVNPYRLESLNTMRFIQDLSSRYGMLALSEGEVSYRVDTKLVSRVCDWIRGSGYTYAFVVGYSTGGMALAYELTVHEESESGPDGAVIISSMVDWKEMIEKHRTSSGVSLYMSARYSKNVRVSALMMYGEEAWFWRQGEEYYRNLPEEGWLGGNWFHKEWRLLKGVEHEVFTLEEDGSYDEKPLAIAVDFLERVRASSLRNIESIMHEALLKEPTNDSPMKEQRIEASYPARVHPYSLFQVGLRVSHVEAAEHGKVAIYDLEEGSFVTLAGASFEKETWHSLPVACVRNQSLRRLAAVAIVNGGGYPRLLGLSAPMKIEVSDRPAIRVETGAVFLNLKIDEETYRTDLEGRLAVYLEKGNHTVDVPETVQLSENERLVFTSWKDGSDKRLIQISLVQDSLVEARYKTQYLLTVYSEYGVVQGGGWYDANSTAKITLSTNSGNERSHVGGTIPVFVGWNDSPSRSLYRQVFMSSPRTVAAIWTLRQSDSNPVWPILAGSTITSVVTIVIYLYSLRNPRTINPNSHSLKKHGQSPTNEI